MIVVAPLWLWALALPVIVTWRISVWATIFVLRTSWRAARWTLRRVRTLHRRLRDRS